MGCRKPCSLIDGCFVMEVVGGGVSDGGHAENSSTDGDGDSDGGVCFTL